MGTRKRVSFCSRVVWPGCFLSSNFGEIGDFAQLNFEEIGKIAKKVVMV